MTPELFSGGIMLRLALAAGIVLLGVVLFRAVNTLTLARARVRAHIPGWDASGRVRPAATLLYFTTPTCTPCKTVQRPAIQRLREQMGDGLEVIEIDASTQPEVAGEWGVLSVPTTFVLDAQGNPRHINHGVTSTEKLLKQVRELQE